MWGAGCNGSGMVCREHLCASVVECVVCFCGGVCGVSGLWVMDQVTNGGSVRNRSQGWDGGIAVGVVVCGVAGFCGGCGRGCACEVALGVFVRAAWRDGCLCDTNLALE